MDSHGQPLYKTRIKAVAIILWTILHCTHAVQTTNYLQPNTTSRSQRDVKKYPNFINSLMDPFESYCGGKGTRCENETHIYCCGSHNGYQCCTSSSACCPLLTRCCGRYCCKLENECRSDGCYSYEGSGGTSYFIPVGAIFWGLMAMICGICKFSKRGDGETHRVGREGGEAL